MPVLTNKKQKTMKKVLLFAAVLSAFSFASCKKDYTCTCSYSVGGTTVSGSTTIHNTKKKAKDACTALATNGETCSVN